MACIPVECAVSMVFATQTRQRRRSTCHCPACHNLCTSANVNEYRPEELPLCMHDEFMTQAKEVESAGTEVQREELAKAYGIKGIPVLSYLRSLRFPWSFPYDFMHLVWENIIPNLVLFWSGHFKGMDEGQPYVLNPHIWQVVGTTSAAATRTIPSSFGTFIPNPATDCSSFTSLTWSVWSLFVAPTVLRGRFPDDCYYKHFCSLVKILNLCLQFEISEEDIDKIESGVRKWVLDYEQCIFPSVFKKKQRLTQSIHQTLLPA